jgi:hypothetical protein
MIQPRSYIRGPILDIIQLVPLVLLDGFPDVIFGCEPTGRENESGNAMKLA